jgi:hypothetical protein
MKLEKNSTWAMKKLLLVTLGLASLCIPTLGQGKADADYRPFSILIISPDSISLHKSLKAWVDTVESDFREVYYSYIKQMELFEKFEPEETRRETKFKIQKAKLAEMDIYNTRYYQFIPMLTCSELWDLFNAHDKHGFSFDFISRDELFSYDTKKIADHYHLDYILTYKQITTLIQNGEPVLKIEMQLFGRTESKIIYEGVAYGRARFYTDNSGILRACSNDLQCLLESGAMASTAELFSFLKRRQKK